MQSRQISISHSTVIALATHGVALATIARSLVLPVAQVKRICERARESGELVAMPPNDPSDVRASMVAELVNLRETCDDQQRRLREIIDVTTDQAVALHGLFRLTRSEAAVVSALLPGARLSKERLHTSIYERIGFRDSEPPDLRIVDVLVCKIRKKFPAGCEIRTLWGYGYQMPAETCSYIKALLVQAESAA